MDFCWQLYPSKNKVNENNALTKKALKYFLKKIGDPCFANNNGYPAYSSVG